MKGGGRQSESRGFVGAKMVGRIIRASHGTQGVMLCFLGPWHDDDGAHAGAACGGPRLLGRPWEGLGALALGLYRRHGMRG